MLAKKLALFLTHPVHGPFWMTFQIRDSWSHYRLADETALIVANFLNLTVFIQNVFDFFRPKCRNTTGNHWDCVDSSVFLFSWKLAEKFDFGRATDRWIRSRLQLSMVEKLDWEISYSSRNLLPKPLENQWYYWTVDERGRFCSLSGSTLTPGCARQRVKQNLSLPRAT